MGPCTEPVDNGELRWDSFPLNLRVMGQSEWNSSSESADNGTVIWDYCTYESIGRDSFSLNLRVMGQYGIFPLLNCKGNGTEGLEFFSF